MNARPSSLGLLVLLGGFSLLPGPAQGLEGRYVGSISRFEGPENVDNTLHSYDASMRESISSRVDLDLRMSLRYQARLGQADSGILGGRFYGDLRGPIWRLRGQLTPWQDLTAGPTPPRSRSAQLAFNLSPRNMPQLDLIYTRGDEESNARRAATDDRRATLSYSRGPLHAGGGYRQVDREISDPSDPGARTEEWKAAASLAPVWQGVSLRSAYEFLDTRYRSAERRLEVESHTVDLGAAWQPLRQLSLGATGLVRIGTTMDNESPRPRDNEERTYGARAGYVPVPWLDLQTSREYRSSVVTGGNAVTDYGQFQATIRRRLLRRVAFQAGWQKFEAYHDSRAIPADNVYAQFEGPLRRGLSGRVELHMATAGFSTSVRRYRQVAQLRGDPIPEMHLEANWRHDALPDSGGPGLTQNEWSVTASFAPESAVGFIANMRWLESMRLVRSTDQLANLLVTWRSSDRSELSFNWSRRTSTTELLETREFVYGLDLHTWLPGEWKLSGSTRQLSGKNRTRDRTLSVSLEKNF